MCRTLVARASPMPLPITASRRTATRSLVDRLAGQKCGNRGMEPPGRFAQSESSARGRRHVPREEVADDWGSGVGSPECLHVTEARYHYRCSGRKRGGGQLGGTVGVLELPADYESRSVDTREVLVLQRSICPALDLEREHLGGGGRKVVHQPGWRWLGFAGRHPFQPFAEPDPAHLCGEFSTTVVGVCRVSYAADADNRGDTLWMASGERVCEPGAVRVADHRGPIDASGVQHCDGVCNVF